MELLTGCFWAYIVIFCGIGLLWRLFARESHERFKENAKNVAGRAALTALERWLKK